MTTAARTTSTRRKPRAVARKRKPSQPEPGSRERLLAAAAAEFAARVRGARNAGGGMLQPLRGERDVHEQQGRNNEPERLHGGSPDADYRRSQGVVKHYGSS